ncbi:MerR family transcriptional regulator [Actinomadura macrotermitis]|uniref:HTH merR-type domain-containing protein n=1 Tax=Actinomadura macrotermitis TaxID=2585200 RepID=A0A7K0C7A2_9ACTN|nr:hypothetical protein [Actinomadura macrotermitis]
MPVTDDTPHGIGIGELARRTGLPVRTVRFYCDEGLLPAARSAGGHRRFDAGAVERLRTVRRLRTLGLGLPAIAEVLAGERSVEEAAAAERAALDAEIAALAWRRASLRAVEEAPPTERAARLELLGAVAQGAAARSALTAFWRSAVVAELPGPLLSDFVALWAPDPPADSDPAQVVAYAGLVALTADRTLLRHLRARGRVNMAAIRDEGELMLGVGAACGLAAPSVAAGEEPGPGPALERFVAAHTELRGGRDDPAFRRHLYRELSLDQDPRIDRYWRLVAEVTGEPVNLGSMHAWLLRGLGRRVLQEAA